MPPSRGQAGADARRIVDAAYTLVSKVVQLVTKSERVKEAVSLTSERKSIKGKTNECAVLANNLQDSFAEQLQWLAVLSAAQFVALRALHCEVRLPVVREKVKRDPKASMSIPLDRIVYVPPAGRRA